LEAALCACYLVVASTSGSKYLTGELYRGGSTPSGVCDCKRLPGKASAASGILRRREGWVVVFGASYCSSTSRRCAAEGGRARRVLTCGPRPPTAAQLSLPAPGAPAAALLGKYLIISALSYNPPQTSIQIRAEGRNQTEKEPAAKSPPRFTMAKCYWVAISYHKYARFLGLIFDKQRRPSSCAAGRKSY
jgi:hypothetical protein